MQDYEQIKGMLPWTKNSEDLRFKINYEIAKAGGRVEMLAAVYQENAKALMEEEVIVAENRMQYTPDDKKFLLKQARKHGMELDYIIKKIVLLRDTKSVKDMAEILNLRCNVIHYVSNKYITK